MKKNFKINILLLFFILFINLFNCNLIIDDNKLLNFKNDTFIINNINNKPNVIYFIYKVPDYPFVYMGSNQILNDSKTKVKTHFPIDDSSVKSEIISIKSRDTIIVTGISDTKENQFKGCSRYFDELNVKVTNCDMIINLVDVSKNDLLYHYSMEYNNLNSTTTTSSSSSDYTIIGMGYRMNENGQFILNIIKADQFTIEDNYYYNNLNQSYKYHSTNISINIKEIESFKKIHDKQLHLYHSLIKDKNNNCFLITFNINQNKIERVIRIDLNLEFSTIGYSIYKNQLILSGSYIENGDNLYFYKFDLNIYQDIINNNNNNSNLLFKKYNKIKYYIKSENNRFFICYLDTNQMIILDIETNEIQEFQIDFKMKHSPHSSMLELYAVHQDESILSNKSSSGLSKSQLLFLIVFHPIFGIALAFLIIGIIVLKKRRDKKNKKEEEEAGIILNQLNLNNLNEEIKV